MKREENCAHCTLRSDLFMPEERERGTDGPYTKIKNAPPTSGIKVKHGLKCLRVTPLLLLSDVLTEGNNC